MAETKDPTDSQLLELSGAGDSVKETIRGRRERKKVETREALIISALKLFKEKGFDETTIENITDSVDVSPRTFFRYFDSKEAVLFGDWRPMLSNVREVILSRPPEESPLVALFSSGEELHQFQIAYQDVIRLRRDLGRESRKILDYERSVILPELEEAIARALEERMGTKRSSDLRPTLYAAVAVGALNAATKVWVENDCKESMAEMLMDAFSFVILPGATDGD